MATHWRGGVLRQDAGTPGPRRWRVEAGAARGVAAPYQEGGRPGKVAKRGNKTNPSPKKSPTMSTHEKE